MGAWGVRNFENDGALDFVGTVMDQGRSLVKYAINKVAQMRHDDDCDCDDAEQCLAAIEFVAAAKGFASTDFPEEGAAWLKKNNILTEDDVTIQKFLRTSDNIEEQCLVALYRVRNASELKELWQDTTDYDAWLEVLDDLKKRLQRS